MKTNKVVTVWFFAFACATFGCIVSLIAQTNGIPTVVEGSAGAFTLPQTWVAIATPLLTLLLTAYIAKVKPKLSLPLVAVIVTTLGTITGALGTVVVGGDKSLGTVGLAAVLALAGVLAKVAADKFGEKPAQ